ncbi:FMN-binding negative transcriptional regulator [Mesorhizobium sp. M7A.F.Ca.CA.001.07.2.1]|uniref:FMN-binding negative transcriptional regulator n=1 Tax=Mesorhizobium TaxID=68287 RepID=UPI000FC9CF63|nr:MULTISPECIES: FMN-binding negative transcriptional regulator [Mesorhizobium]RVB43544.1 FMN-binding negative transcriptional regulator [Mesorhizobium sp. M7A.F.Ca.CA.004.05.1.1]MCF6127301.1 FMN-binding negative transcriptional regulator [Mesorhizobium ciceri]MCQ8817652.1 FMN-binding negative transcriptional regulator [Mesorhizobium sp. SEMIA396]RUX69195.1 FMN-binding negative transcriptional regulator [Mesorhizobium sp. M7A.F.Ca.CA.004.08.2.1]RUX82580.1 FMN-binding negative transcriptional r
MYTKLEFAPLSRDEVFGLIEAAAFAAVVTSGPQGLVVSHLPFVLDRARGENGTLVSHLARANPHSALIAEGRETVAIFHGPHGYISPSWYPRNPVRDSAPTWNFAVVHCHGHPVPLDDHATARHLLQLVDVLEKERDDRWCMRELGPGGMERRIPHILGFDLPIERLEAKFKMGQDERLYDTGGAIGALEQNDPALAAMMKAHNAHRQD